MSDENTLILSGVGTSLKSELDVPISGDYQIALQGLSTYYSWPNITATNNVLKYTIGGTQKSITFPPGAYDMKAMASFITSELKRKGDGTAFRLGANTNTLKAVIDVNLADCVVNIGDSTIKSILGWTTGDLAQGTHTSPNKVNISNVNEVLVHCNIAKGVYTAESSGRLSRQTVLASFYPDVAPGYKVNIEPRQLFYSPVNTPLIKEVAVWLTNQDYELIDNDDEILSVKLHIKPYYNK